MGDYIVNKAEIKELVAYAERRAQEEIRKRHPEWDESTIEHKALDALIRLFEAMPSS